MMDPNPDDPPEEGENNRQPEPEVVPAISSEQMPIVEGVGGAYAQRTRDADADNDQESHVSPADNDGETVPRDEVDQVVG